MHMHAKYHILKTLGINLWLQKKKDVAVIVKSPLLYAHCFILLALAPIEMDKASEIYKVLQGMIKVLNLRSDEYCVGHLSGNNPDAVMRDIGQWRPYTLLVLGQSQGQRLLSNKAILPCQSYLTYHPAELIEAPQHKRRAYQDLLALKTTLEALSAS